MRLPSPAAWKGAMAGLLVLLTYCGSRAYGQPSEDATWQIGHAGLDYWDTLPGLTIRLIPVAYFPSDYQGLWTEEEYYGEEARKYAPVLWAHGNPGDKVNFITFGQLGDNRSAHNVENVGVRVRYYNQLGTARMEIEPVGAWWGGAVLGTQSLLNWEWEDGAEIIVRRHNNPQDPPMAIVQYEVEFWDPIAAFDADGIIDAVDAFHNTFGMEANEVSLWRDKEQEGYMTWGYFTTRLRADLDIIEEGEGVFEDFMSDFNRTDDEKAKINWTAHTDVKPHATYATEVYSEIWADHGITKPDFPDSPPAGFPPPTWTFTVPLSQLTFGGLQWTDQQVSISWTWYHVTGVRPLVHAFTQTFAALWCIVWLWHELTT